MYKKICATSVCKKINIYNNPAYTQLPNTEEVVPVIDLFYYATKPCDVYSQLPVYHQLYYNGYPQSFSQSYPAPPQSFSQSYSQSYPAPQQSYPAPPQSFSQSYPAPQQSYPAPQQGYYTGGCISCGTK